MEADGLTFHVSRAMLWGLGFYATLISIAVISLLIPDIRNILKGSFSAVVSKLGLDQISPTLAAFGILLWVTIFFILLLGFPWLLLQAVFDAPPVNAQEIGERRWLLVSLTALVAALGAVVALPFTLIKTRQNERQTRATEEGLITDRINNAVEGLGAEKKIDRIGRPVTRPTAGGGEEITIEWKDKPIDGAVPVEGAKWEVFSETRPNLEVRIGAILALERLARNNLDIHVQIMEILCAYIRENAPARDAEPVAELQIFEDEEGGPLREDWGQRLDEFMAQLRADTAQLKPREDIQVALTVLGRRSADGRLQEARRNAPESKAAFVFDTSFSDSVGRNEDGSLNLDDLDTWQQALTSYTGYRLDLRGANLQGADLAQFNLRAARFQATQMQGANLKGAQMQGADLWGAQMQGVNLWEAQMQGADLWATQMQGANLREAQMQGADLTVAQMQGANLWATQMQGVNLTVAQMQGAVLWGAQMQGAVLWGAQMQGSILRDAQFDAATDMMAADLTKAAVKAVDFKKIPQTAEHLAGLFGDATTQLPDGIDAPDHWPKFNLNWDEFETEWKKWKADPDTYVPPDPPSRT
jgi:uncharacterized protein YjbI with pentapeptide repeats